MIIDDLARASKLVTLKDTLYKGSWEAMEKELTEQQLLSTDSLGVSSAADLELLKTLRKIEQSGKDPKAVIAQGVVDATQPEGY